MAKIIDYEAEVSGERKVVLNATEAVKKRKNSAYRLYQYAKSQKKAGN